MLPLCASFQERGWNREGVGRGNRERERMDLSSMFLKREEERKRKKKKGPNTLAPPFYRGFKTDPSYLAL
jgi:hypothetical protein